MRLRFGFVSNSSSSIFIVYLPKNFDIRKHLSKTEVENIGIDKDYDEFCQIFDNLVKDQEYVNGEDKYFWDVCKILEHLNCVLYKIEVGSDCGDIKIIDIDKINDIVLEVERKYGSG